MSKQQESKCFLFLDVDGVLNTKAYHETLEDPRPPWTMDDPTEDDWLKMIDADAVARLNQIVEATGCQIILSSTWRIGYGPAPRMQELLKSLGFEGTFVGVTPQTFGGSRLREIKLWLEDNHGGEPYVILDDDTSLTHSAELEARWVQTYYEGAGLGEAEVRSVINILKEGP